MIVIEMNNGKVIKLELDETAAPKTVANFNKLVSEGFYDGLSFHRIIPGFMIQGGDPIGNGTGGSKENIVGEFASNGFNNPIKHTRGVISMARSMGFKLRKFPVLHHACRCSTLRWKLCCIRSC